jgi:hypothetical protein
MLLRAHLEREADEVASILQPDLKFVLSKAPILLEEMLKVRPCLGTCRIDVGSTCCTQVDMQAVGCRTMAPILLEGMVKVQYTSTPRHHVKHPCTLAAAPAP